MYNAINYIDKDSTHICSEGIDKFETVHHEFLRAERVNRENDIVGYEFSYLVKLSRTSYDYWGKAIRS